MNPTKEANGDLCEMAMDCLGTTSYLSRFPKLMKKIIETRAWECREFRGKVYKLPSLADLITREALEGWGESLEKVKKLLEDDEEVCEMFRAEISGKKGGDNGNRYKKKSSNNNNIIIAKPKQGTDKAYTLNRIKRTDEKVFKQVCAGEMSANAAAILLGIRKQQVTVTSDPDKTAKTLKNKFGNDYIKELIKVLQKELT